MLLADVLLLPDSRPFLPASRTFFNAHEKREGKRTHGCAAFSLLLREPYRTVLYQYTQEKGRVSRVFRLVRCATVSETSARISFVGMPASFAPCCGLVAHPVGSATFRVISHILLVPFSFISRNR